MYSVAVTIFALVTIFVYLFHKIKKEIEHKMEEINKKISSHVENSSNKNLKESISLIQDSSYKEVSKVLAPIKEQLQVYESKMEKMIREEVGERAKVNEFLKNITETNRTFSEEAKTFSKAMRGDIRALGKFGEDSAEMILIASGYQEGHSFYKQKTLSTDNGSIRPDFMINLPQERAIFIDSKLSLDSFMSYMEAEDEDKRIVHGNGFVDRMRDHIKTLTKANYVGCLEFKSMDYVMMFVGSDNAISLALDYDPELQRDALKKGILIVGPTTLMCSLKSIEILKREEKQMENLKEISEIGGHLYMKITHFVENLKKSHECLEKSEDALRKAMNHLVKGEKSILGDAKKLNELGNFSSESIDFPELEE